MLYKTRLRLIPFVLLCYCPPGLELISIVQARPNFVVIVVDDMGYSDPGCFGGEIETPNLDRLASRGLRFTQFYNCSRCCQTRASLLTGAYPHRVGMREFGRTMGGVFPTLPENLRDGGYATAMVGKWHLSELPQTQDEQRRILWMNHQLDLGIPFAELGTYPTRRGFDRFYGIIWGVVDHFDPFSLTEGEAPVAEVPEGFYMTDAISQRAVDYLDDFANSSQPFFLYVAYTAPHWPLHAPEEAIAKYHGKYNAGWQALREQRFARQLELGLVDNHTPLGPLSGGKADWGDLPPEQRAYLADKMAVHAAMVDRVDQGIGEIVQQLEDSGLMDNTVLFFLSDNGASPEIPGGPGYDRQSGTRDGRLALREAELRKPSNRDKLGSDESYTGIGPRWASAVNTPLRLWKAESYEGGCRTPLIVHWPQGIADRHGELVADVGHVIDLAPTCYQLAEVIPRPDTLQDGVSLVPALEGQSPAGERTLFFEHGQGGGVRRGKWKASKRRGEAWQLFDLLIDPGETNDLAPTHGELLNTLVEAWQQWRK